MTFLNKYCMCTFYNNIYNKYIYSYIDLLLQSDWNLGNIGMPVSMNIAVQ